MNERTGRPQMVFDPAAFDDAVKTLELETKEAKAAFLGVPRPTFSKVVNGKATPNNEFIARVFIKLPRHAARIFRAEVR